MRLIDAEQIGLTDMEIILCDGNYKKAVEMLIDKIAKAPTIDAAPVKRGVWVTYTDGSMHCSNCSKIPINRIYALSRLVYDVDIGSMMKYCPRCGARMDYDDPDPIMTYTWCNTEGFQENDFCSKGKSMTKRFKKWAIWRRQNRNGLLYQLLVLLRITSSPSFEMYYGERKEP